MTHPPIAAVDTPLFDTAPPGEVQAQSSLARFKQALVGKASKAILPLMKRAAGAYLGGETVEEALAVAHRVAAEGHASTLGYWDTGPDDGVLAIYHDAISKIASDGLESYLSLKPPALRYAADAARALAAAAAPHAMRLHCDCHGPEVADLHHAFTEALCEILPPELIGVALPGRWQRSLQDADWTMARGFKVRVVKGQWPDPADRNRDLGEGFLAVIDRLCRGARHVAVATHDAPLAREAIARLQAAGVSHELEVLLGYPAAPLLAWAKEAGIKTRVYVPYGPGFVPNAIAVLRRNPRLLMAVGKERIGAVKAFITKR
jgi:proline dehydrogenase